MAKVVFVIDGWFMWRRVKDLKAFYYNGPAIRDYCKKHLHHNDQLYRIFYYDTKPLDKKGHNPINGKPINFAATSGAKAHNKLLESIKKTPHFALRLGRTVWHNNEWTLESKAFDSLLDRSLSVDTLTENDVRPLIKQKAVDMKMGLDIAWIAMKKLADLLIIITGDADVVPVLKFARREGMQVCLDPLRSPIGADLSEHVDYISTRIPKPTP